MGKNVFDVAIIGGGIVGTATAYALVERGVRSLVVLEAEDSLAAHQTGHNSGVIHAGLYYKPGSLKAKNCVAGREKLYQFCEANGVPAKRCGKVVVATKDEELPRLEKLFERGQANGLVNMRKLSPEEVREHEPHVKAVGGIFVPYTGVVNYRKVTEKLGERVQQGGGDIRTKWKLRQVRASNGSMAIETTQGLVECRHLVNCGGLQADRVARLCGVEPGLQIIPFRGEYYDLIPERAHLVKTLIYPVPDPQFPFLGVHFTRGVDDHVEAGPNAVLALARTGYNWRTISPRDLWGYVSYLGFWRLILQYPRMGLAEMYRSLNKSAFLRSLQQLIPEVQMEDIIPGGAGVRAQAVAPEGKLIDDFHIVEADRMIHVLNAPSPAATASLSIGETIADLVEQRFGLKG
ncbi:MAG: L-2-hydroxyglutarate oxidase [Gemmataceae bacterium]